MIVAWEAKGLVGLLRWLFGLRVGAAAVAPGHGNGRAALGLQQGVPAQPLNSKPGLISNNSAPHDVWVRIRLGPGH